MMRVYVPGYGHIPVTLRCAGYDDEGRLLLEVTPIIGPDGDGGEPLPLADAA